MNNWDDLEKRISNLSDEELIKMLYMDFQDYRDEAIQFAKEEFLRRNLNEPEREKIVNIQNKSSSSEEPGFFWGALFIIMNFIFGILLILGGIIGIINEFQIKSLELLSIGILSLLMAYGIQKRKKWGFYLVLIAGVSELIYSIAFLIISKKTTFQWNHVHLFAIVLWLIYFLNRRELFK